MRLYVFTLLVLLVTMPCSAQTRAERWTTADTDRSGTLSRAEAARGFSELARDFEAIDANRDGELTPDEVRTWRRASRASRGAPRDALAAEFAHADVNGDGRLSRHEAEPMPRLAQRFGALDRDGDGTLTLDELRERVAERRDARQPKTLAVRPAPR